MPRTDITLQSLVPNGATADLTVVTADSANNHEFTNPGNVLLVVVNKDAALALQVTVVSVAEPKFGRTGDVVQTLAATKTRIFGPFDPAGFNQSNGKVNVDVDQADTDMELFCIPK